MFATARSREFIASSIFVSTTAWESAAIQAELGTVSIGNGMIVVSGGLKTIQVFTLAQVDGGPSLGLLHVALAVKEAFFEDIVVLEHWRLSYPNNLLYTFAECCQRWNLQHLAANNPLRRQGVRYITTEEINRQNAL